MASAPHQHLNAAVNSVNGALARLEAAVLAAATMREASAQARAQVQAEANAQWQQKYTAMEEALAAAQAQQEFLTQENQRLSNALQTLQQEHVALQQTANNTVSRLSASVSQLDLLLGQTA